MSRPKILLKARPTPAQMTDRQCPPVPDGVELYLDAADIRDQGWRDRLLVLVNDCRRPCFDFIVEGPLRSLDGAFFDVTDLNVANREVIDRVVSFGAEIGARGAVIHAMAARSSAAHFNEASHAEALDRALATFHHYCQSCQRAGLTPTVENVPPVARMREGSYMFSIIGTTPQDILALVQAMPGLRVTIDVSHAQLYANAYRIQPTEVAVELRPMVEFLRVQPGVSSVEDYLSAVGGNVFEAHVSNARGLLGEGLRYTDGELDIDRLIRRLSREAQFLVTETLEPDPNRATYMREAQRRMMQVLDQQVDGVDHVG